MPKQKIIIPILIIIVAIISLPIYFNQNKKLTTKTVASNRDNLRISIDGIPSENLPTSGNYYLTKYKCYSTKTKVTWDRKNYKLNISNHNKKAGVSCNLVFNSNPPISEMKIGSYIKYQGSGGKVGSNNITCKLNGTPSSVVQTDDTESPNSCLGENAREDLDTKKTYGYCYNSDYKFYTTGWRIAYINKDNKDTKAVIISAASPECINTSDNNILNTKSLKYCNKDYVDNNCICEDQDENGLCDSKPKDAWHLNDEDFTKIISSETIKEKSDINGFNINNCFNTKSTASCGYNNDLIDNGSYYWFSTTDNSYWNPDNRIIFTGQTKSFGLRPIIQLSSSVVVIDGEGTMDDPYIISNNNFTINNGAQFTTKREVNLNILASNASKMCISNNNKCEDYVDFDNKATWKLTDKDGTKTVYVYLKDNNGKLIATLNRKIILDSIGPTNNKLSIKDKNANKITLNIESRGAETICINTSDNIEQCNWIPYQEEYEYILDNKNGVKTIYSFFQDKAGNISNKSLTYDCETCSDSFNASYIFDGTKTIENINAEKRINISSNSPQPWIIDSQNKYLKSTNTNINNSASISTITIKPTAPASLSFEYGVSSEANYDKLTITIKDENTSNTLVNSISGTKEDKITNYNLEADKTYELILNYKKDEKGNIGKDIGYIKNIIIK
ncbi:MAG: hypothetical protein VZS44_04495 [Bacilli bacterium]|nr:hypothetical protein [Bacilli bacterium]